ncbi:MAG: hypothetical protein JWN49_313 [Parcubacteria group bacterium]|nr:hypothetical protein [Parcubacteria group bacterium]
MNSDEHTPTVQERIMAKIQDHELTMHSRLFFVVRVVATALLAFMVLLISIFLVNFLFFTLRVNGHEPLLALGSRGAWLFVQLFPWWLLVLDIVCIVVLENVLRTFKFGYRSPVLYLFLVLVVVASAIGIGLDRGTDVNDRILRHADRGDLPGPLNSLYQEARRAPPQGGAYRGIVHHVMDHSFTLVDPDRIESEFLVELPENHPTPPLSEGEAVFVLGDEKDGVIHAVDVHPIDPDGIPPGAHMPPAQL